MTTPQQRADDPFVRAFVGIGLGEEVRVRLADAQERLKKAGARVSWVRPENLHLSLEFLGDLSLDKLPAVARAVEEAAAGSAAFVLDVRRVGFFGRRNVPRVIWAGVSPEAALMALQAGLHEAFTALGIPLEDRAYVPHVTLGRVRPGGSGRDALAAALGQAAELEFGRVGVSHIALMRSLLKPSGPVYTSLLSAPLQT